jgi:thymidylate kinase
LPVVVNQRRQQIGGPVRGRRRAARGRPLVIALVGIDGSGKTTQARRLADALTAAGVPATYWQNAGGRRWFSRLARRLGERDAQRLLGRRGLLVVESVLRWLAIARALGRSRLTRRAAVMDRYAVCQYASIRAHGGRRPGERLARLAYRIFPPPDITFLLAVEPQEAFRRIEMRGTDHEDLRYLAAAQDAYQALPEYAGFAVVDANPPLDRVTRAIFDRVPALTDKRPASEPVVPAASRSPQRDRRQADPPRERTRAPAPQPLPRPVSPEHPAQARP